MIKSKILIERKDTLLRQLSEIEKAIAEETRKLDDSNLNKFIKDGLLKTQDGFRIQKLKKEKNSLLAVEKGLHRSIYIARQKEREKEVEKVKNRKDDIEKQKEKVLYQLKKRLLQVAELQREVKKFSDPLMIIKQDLKVKQDTQEVVHFKLAEIEEFLAGRYIKCPEEIRDAVAKEIEENKKAFTPGIHPVGHSRSQVFAGFMATIQKDSGVCELKHPENSGWSVDLAFHNEIVKKQCLGEK